MPSHVGYGRKVGGGSDRENMQETDELGQYTEGSTNPESDRTEEGRNEVPQREDFKTRLEWLKAMAEWKRSQKPSTPPQPQPNPDSEPKKEYDNYLGLPLYKDFDPKDPFASMGLVNPKYSTGKKEYRTNCQRCYVAAELRYRGYDVEAKPREPDINSHKLEYAQNAIYETGDGSNWMSLTREKYYEKYGEYPEDNTMRVFYKLNSPFVLVFKGAMNEGMSFTRSLGQNPKSSTVMNRIMSKIKSTQYGSRFAMCFTYKGSNNGHITNVVNVNGVPYVYESQTNNVYELTEFYFSTKKPSSVAFFRIDDKEIDKRYIDILVKPR